MPAKKSVSTKKKPKRSEKEEFYADEEQGILPKKTSEEKELGMKVGEESEDIYEEEGRELLEEDDEINPWEEGFMKGSSGPGQLGKDALTGVPLLDVEDVVEEEIDGRLYRFASRQNARKFLEKKRKEQGKHQEE